MVDLATGASARLGGDGPVFSDDGRYVAYVEGVLMGEPPNYTIPQQVFIASVDGSNERQITRQPDEDSLYDVVDWSDDGTQLLVNHWTVNDDGTLDEVHLAVLDIATGTFRRLASGYAQDGAWYKR